MKTHLKIAFFFPLMLLKHRRFVREDGVKSLWRSLRFNLNYFTTSEALKLPVYISSNYRLKTLQGTITITEPLVTGMIRFGTYEIGTYDKKSDSGILDLKSGSQLTFHGKARFGVGCRISLNPDAHLSFGNDFVVTAASTFICSNRISFGQSCLLSWEILFMDTDLHMLLPKSSKPEEIHIGDRNWIGCRCTILKSTKTGANCVIGANSQLSKSYPGDKVLISGSPAKIVRENIDWK